MKFNRDELFIAARVTQHKDFAQLSTILKLKIAEGVTKLQSMDYLCGIKEVIRILDDANADLQRLKDNDK